MNPRRETILETFRLTLASIDPQMHGSGAYPYSFSSVGRLPLGEPNTTKRLVGAVLAGDESKDYQVSFVTCFFQVTVDFAFTVNKGDDAPATEVEKIIAMIQKAMLTDPTLNRVVLDTFVSGVSVELDASPEKVIEGAVFFTVHYRHDLNDTRTYMGSSDPQPTPINLT